MELLEEWNYAQKLRRRKPYLDDKEERRYYSLETKVMKLLDL